MKEYVIGLESELGALPAEVDIDNEPYYLTKNDDGYILLSRYCPHAGGTVQEHGAFYFCPLHMWKFDGQSGECVNVPGCGLDSFPVDSRDGQLVARFA